MLKKIVLLGIVVFLFSLSYAEDSVSAASVAPESLNGHRMIMSYYEATGDVANKIGETYYADLKEHTFYSALLNGQKGHDGYYSYRRLSNTEAVITVEHPEGLYKGWSYSMNLHFSNPQLGTFDIVDHGMMNGSLQGVFTLS